MKKIKAIAIGAGMRGTFAYAPYALEHPNELQYVAVAEQNKERLDKFQKLHNIPDEMCFSSWEEIIQKPQLADAAIICTQDRMHFEPCMKALERGYNVLLEKPMSPDPLECIKLGEQAKKYNKIFSICHVLRYTSFFTTLKKLLNDGRIGKLISIQHNENVGYWHQAHSFVRGNWRNSAESSPMILAKCCHDMDIMLWLAGADCTKISSFGSLTHFTSKNAPEGAPKRCLDGCPAERECPFHAAKIYIGAEHEWLPQAISNDISNESIIAALKEGPYGRCVYYCDNDVVDHQVVNIEFANEVTAAFTMCAFTKECSRTIKLMGTKGEIRGAMEKNEIEIIDFVTGAREVINISTGMSGHGGGDEGLMYDFVRLLQSEGKTESLTSADISVQSHLMAFAAEKARLENRVVNLREYKEELVK